MKFLIPLLLATPAFADGYELSKDILEMREGNPWPEVYYKNDVSQNSLPVVGQTLELNGIEVQVWIQLSAGPNGEERITVKPTDSQLIAIPAEADVLDGEDITIIIMPPMF